MDTEIELTDDQLDTLQDYFAERWTESDDVDKEEARFEIWLESMTKEEIEAILEAPSVT